MPNSDVGSENNSSPGVGIFLSNLTENAKQTGANPNEILEVLQQNPALAMTIINLTGSIDSLTKANRLDSQTKLSSSAAFEQDSNTFVKHLIDFEDLSVNDRTRLDNTHLFRSDIGLLSYANKLPGFHENGDRYKKEMADVLSQGEKGSQFEVFPYAMTKGDEFGGFVYAEHSDINHWTEDVKERAETISLAQDGDSLLNGNIDIGIVGLGEFFDEFKKYSLEANLTPQQSKEQYLSFLNKMADFRQTYNKILNRIDFLSYLEDMYIAGKITADQKKEIWLHGARPVDGIDETKLNDLKTNKISGRGFAINTLRKGIKKIDSSKKPENLEEFIAVAMKQDLTVEEFKEYALQ